MRAISSAGILAATCGSLPVAGRPRLFFGATFIDCFNLGCTVKAGEPGRAGPSHRAMADRFRLRDRTSDRRGAEEPGQLPPHLLRRLIVCFPQSIISCQMENAAGDCGQLRLLLVGRQRSQLPPAIHPPREAGPDAARGATGPTDMFTGTAPSFKFMGHVLPPIVGDGRNARSSIDGLVGHLSPGQKAR